MTEDHPGDAAAAPGAHSKDAMGGAKAAAAPSCDSTIDIAQDMAARLTERVRERPITAVLAAVAVGWLIGRIGRYV